MRLLVKIVEDWLVRRQEVQGLGLWCARRSVNVRDSRRWKKKKKSQACGWCRGNFQ